MPSHKPRKSAVKSAVNQIQAPATNAVIARLLTPDEVAVLLGINRLAVIRQSRAGKIPALKIGKVYRYHAGTLTTWLAGGVQ